MHTIYCRMKTLIFCMYMYEYMDIYVGIHITDSFNFLYILRCVEFYAMARAVGVKLAFTPPYSPWYV